MKKPFEIEFYLNGDVIDLKSYDILPAIPEVGEMIYLECDNPSNTNHSYFNVKERSFLFFNAPNLKQKVLIKLEPTESVNW